MINTQKILNPTPMFSGPSFPTLLFRCWPTSPKFKMAADINGNCRISGSMKYKNTLKQNSKSKPHVLGEDMRRSTWPKPSAQPRLTSHIHTRGSIASVQISIWLGSIRLPDYHGLLQDNRKEGSHEYHSVLCSYK